MLSEYLVCFYVPFCHLLMVEKKKNLHEGEGVEGDTGNRVKPADCDKLRHRTIKLLLYFLSGIF